MPKSLPQVGIHFQLGSCSGSDFLPRKFQEPLLLSGRIHISRECANGGQSVWLERDRELRKQVEMQSKSWGNKHNKKATVCRLFSREAKLHRNHLMRIVFKVKSEHLLMSSPEVCVPTTSIWNKRSS